MKKLRTTIILLTTFLSLVSFSQVARVKENIPREKMPAIDNIGLEKSIQLKNIQTKRAPVKPDNGDNTNTVSIITLGTSANGLGYGYGGGQKTMVWADDNLGAVVNIHRMGPGSTPPGLSGYIACDLGTNHGVASGNWQNNRQIYASTLNGGGSYYTDAARYPQGGIYNPTGNTNLSNAYVAYFAPNLSTTSTTWGGRSYGVDNCVNQADSTKHLYWYNAPPYYTYIPDGFAISQQGISLVADISQQWSGSNFIGYQGNIIVNRGVWNSTSHDFNYSMFNVSCPTLNNRKPSSARVAFSPDGQTAWMVVIGNNGINIDSSYYPILCKSVNAGLTWSAPINVVLDGPDGILGITQHLLSDYNITQLFYPPYPGRDEIAYTTGFDCRISVDMWGNPHIGVVIGLCPGGFSISTGDSAFAVYDIYSTDGGITWAGQLMGYPSTFRGNFTQGSSGATEDNRVCIASNMAGNKMFLTWNDTQVPGVTDNSQCDIFARGFDLVQNKITKNTYNNCEPNNVTLLSEIMQQANFQCLSYYVFSNWPTSNKWTLPIVSQYLTVPGDLEQPVEFKYISNFSYSQTDFTCSVFPENPTPGSINLTLTVPNGGENWTIGSVHNITWSSTGITNVKLEYTTNNGSTWTTIVSTYAASAGSYAWTVPNAPSTQCKVRISESGNSSMFDVSDNFFTISNSQSISVTNPNGGENWQVGSSHNITWTSSGITNVKIEYTTNNGSTWTTIISTYPAGSGSYSWTIPNTQSTQCKVRISDSGNPAINDMSDNVFTISSNSQSISVTNPNGGENWLVGSNQTITWTSTGVSSVTIEYTTDNGSTWTTIASAYTASIGTYSWTVPNNPSTQCKIKISDSGNPSLYDMSDNVFTISANNQSISVTNPNGGENWQIGSVHNITWTSSGITNVKIEYTTNNGNTWTTIISNYAANSGMYSWTIPNTPGTQCKVRISDSGNPAINDMSDNVFTISSNSQSILVTNPNGGENWQAGSVNTITWTSSGVNNVKIEYTIDNGTSWTTIISYYNAIAGSYSWTVPNTPSTQCKVRISDSGNPALNDLSDNVFTISTSSQSIILNNPNGGETWQVGSIQNITWNCSGITNVRIEYSSNGGINWNTIISSYPAVTNSYPWAVPNTPSNQCKVRISDSGNASLSDISDSLFTISIGGQSTPEICIVTVDSINNKNMIVWEKPFSTSIDHYNIYVEGNQANVYNLIGSVPYSNMSVFTDLSSNPLQQANRYKISIVDINNIETSLSDEHMTIHLSINQGAGNTFNLQWNNYLGFDFPSLNIYRGTNPLNMTLLATVASSINSFTDLYPPGGYVYYKMEVIKPVPCSPSKTMISSSFSNLSSNDPYLSVGPSASSNSQVNIFPNPTTGMVRIVSNTIIDNLSIYNSVGMLVKIYHGDSNDLRLNLSDLGQGVYYLRLKIGATTEVYKIIIL